MSIFELTVQKASPLLFADFWLGGDIVSGKISEISGFNFQRIWNLMFAVRLHKNQKQNFLTAVETRTSCHCCRFGVWSFTLWTHLLVQRLGNNV